MLVKIGDTIYDSVDQPISIYLTDQDKQSIADMHPESHYVTDFPLETESESLDTWVEQFKDFVAKYEETHGKSCVVMKKGLYSNPEDEAES